MMANRIKYTWIDQDGTEHYEILQISELPINLTSMTAYNKEETVDA